MEQIRRTPEDFVLLLISPILACLFIACIYIFRMSVLTFTLNNIVSCNNHDLCVIDDHIF